MITPIGYVILAVITLWIIKSAYTSATTRLCGFCEQRTPLNALPTNRDGKPVCGNCKKPFGELVVTATDQ